MLYNKNKLLIIITFLGGYLRFNNLGVEGLWIDEALFGFWIKGGFPTQEFVPVFIGKLFHLNTEFGLRSISAISGTLTIPAIYFCLSNKDNKMAASLLVAVFPIFVFWSRMARPYALVGLFIVLGWRYWWVYSLAILTTPISLIGVRFIKQKKFVIIGAVITAIFLYLIREDAGRAWTFKQFLVSTRWHYVPILVFILYFFDYFLPLLVKRRTQLVQIRSKI